MPLTEQFYKLLANSRTEARKEIVELFLLEQSGTGKGELSSRYAYTVENYADVYTVIIKRPAGLNKGFDFVVHIGGMSFKSKKKYTNPSHNDIIHALKEVQSSSSVLYNNVIIDIIRKVYNLQDFDISLLNSCFFTDFNGQERPIAIIILAIKWLFIEQDITYWNWSGRAMLMNKLEEEGLV